MAEESWKRWGENDERGALNLIGAEETRHALTLAKQGKTFSLAQNISAKMPSPGQRLKPAHFMDRDGGDYEGGARTPGGFQFADDTMLMPLHVGTHIDCLCHVWYGGKLYNGYAQNNVRSNGSLRCDAVSMGPIVTRGVLLDFVATAGAPLADGAVIDANMVREAMKRAGVTLRKGDAVLLRTGWLERHQDAGTADFNTEPGIDLEAGLMLAQSDVALVGADNFSVEVLPFASGTVFPVHQRLIRDYGIPLLEGLVLKPLAEAGATEFLFMAAPLPLAGATASPIAPVAVL